MSTTDFPKRRQREKGASRKKRAVGEISFKIVLNGRLVCLSIVFVLDRIMEMIEEKDLSAEILLKTIEQGMKNRKGGKDFNKKSLQKTIKAAKEKVNPDAAGKIVDEVLLTLQRYAKV